MKKIILLILISLTITAQAGLWEKITTIGEETQKPSATYLVETAGWNIRVYEWIPKDNPNVRCMFAAGSQKGGVACYSINH